MDIVIGASVRFLKLIVLRNCTGLKFADKGKGSGNQAASRLRSS
jgi:hypothetical protein